MMPRTLSSRRVDHCLYRTLGSRAFVLKRPWCRCPPSDRALVSDHRLSGAREGLFLGPCEPETDESIETIGDSWPRSAVHPAGDIAARVTGSACTMIPHYASGDKHPDKVGYQPLASQ